MGRWEYTVNTELYDLLKANANTFEQKPIFKHKRNNTSAQIIHKY